jgi:hypothetical protein
MELCQVDSPQPETPNQVRQLWLRLLDILAQRVARQLQKPKATPDTCQSSATEE